LIERLLIDPIDFQHFVRLRESAGDLNLIPPQSE